MQRYAALKPDLKLVIASFLMTVTLLVITGTTYAHVRLKSSAPANGAALNSAPKTIALEFEHPARLTRLKLIKVNKPGAAEPIPVELDLKASAAASFSIPVPELAPGNYQINWTTLAEDGHVMNGSLSFSVEIQH